MRKRKMDEEEAENELQGEENKTKAHECIWKFQVFILEKQSHSSEERSHQDTLNGTLLPAEMGEWVLT